MVNILIVKYFTKITYFSDVGLDIQDDLGRHEVGFVDDTDKQPINNGLGCRFTAGFKINKVRAWKQNSLKK